MRPCSPRVAFRIAGRCEDEELRERAFKKAIVDDIERWVGLAEERLRDTGIRCFITPGNDDFCEIDRPLKASDVVEFVEGACVRLDDRHEMITTGYSNRTPWDSPRELDEDDLLALLERMFAEVEEPDRAVVVVHVPPYGTQLDKAPEIDEDFRVKMEGGSPRLISVGSTAVRRFIEERQPLLGLHGHVHDSGDAVSVGPTLCINPGSEYGTGTLLGAIVELNGHRVCSHQIVTG